MEDKSDEIFVGDDEAMNHSRTTAIHKRSSPDAMTVPRAQ